MNDVFFALDYRHDNILLNEEVSALKKKHRKISV